jgi:5'(3')-deoxyribonucleotidase
MNKPTVLLDVDGILADFAGALLRWAGPQYKREQLTEWDLTKALGLEDRQAPFDEYASVVTSPYSAARLWTFERLRWLERHFGFSKYDVIFAKRKYLVRGDVMIDDGPHNIEEFVNRGGRGVLIHQPWNASSELPGAERCRTLEQALEAVRHEQGGEAA